MYKSIVNPVTEKTVSVFGKLGRNIINGYLKHEEMYVDLM